MKIVGNNTPHPVVGATPSLADAVAGRQAPSFVPMRHAQTASATVLAVEQAPGAMMIRELLQNGLEAAAPVASAKRRGKVVFSAWDQQLSDGTHCPKLLVRNTGIGMDEAELLSVMQLNSSGGGKINGVKNNFGVGAKTTGLKNNPAGMRYRSCKRGRVHQAVLVKFGEDYGLLNCPDGKGGYAAVIDVSHEYTAEERVEDWTEVVLMGQEAGHDTTRQPFLQGRTEPSNWIAASVNHRFYALPEFVDVEIADRLDLNKQKQGRVLRGAGETYRRSAAPKGHARVRINDDVEIEYILIEKKGQNRYALDPCCGVVHRGEIYDLKTGNDWGRVAVRYGVCYGFREVAIFVHLCDDAKVSPDRYRQRIQRDEPAKPEVLTEDYSEIIASNLPEFIKQHIEKNKMSTQGDSQALQDRLKRLAEQYDWRRRLLKPDPAGLESAGRMNARDGSGKGGDNSGSARNRSSMSGDKPAVLAGTVRRGELPQVSWELLGTRSASGLWSGFAATYDSKLHLVRMNLEYEGITAAVERCVQRWAGLRDQQALREDALKECKDEYHLRACKAVMHAYMHENDRGWKQEDINASLSHHALTICLDDVYEVADAAIDRLKQKWGRKAA